MKTHARHLLALSFTALLAACGGGDGDSTGSNPPATVSAPAITTAPVSSTVNAGGTATLTVVASGDTALSYQWRRDGVNIAGATGASYTTPVLAVGDSGQAYTVVVSNAGGQSTTSTAAVLTVTAAPAAPTIALTQDSANQLVAEVNAGVAQLQQAGLVEGLLPFGSQSLALPIGAVQTLPLEYCTSGNASMTLTTNDTTGQPVSAAITFNNCSSGFDGVSASVNGSATMTVTAWTNEENYTIVLAYDIAYTTSGISGVGNGTYRGQQTCTIAGEVENCSADFGDNDLSDVNVRTEGNLTTVETGRITNANVDCVYDGWVFDTTAGRATSGTVTVVAPNGDRAVITATSTGYTVVITAGGSSSTFSVAFAS